MYPTCAFAFTPGGQVPVLHAAERRPAAGRLGAAPAGDAEWFVLTEERGRIHQDAAHPRVLHAGRIR